MLVMRDAYRLLEVARAAGYTLPEGFAGFSAQLKLFLAGDWHQGSVVARSPREIELHLLKDLCEWPQRELASMLAHRSPRPFAQSEGQHGMRVIEEGPLGISIGLADSMHSVLRVHDGQIVMVERNFPKSSFRIHIHTHAPAGDRHLPEHFSVIYRDAEGKLEAVESFTDSYTAVEGVWLPSRRQVVRHDLDGLTVREMLLSGHVLLTIDS